MRTHPSQLTVEQIEEARAEFVGYGKNPTMRKETVSGGVVYLSERDGRFNATGFTGKALKPAFHLYFTTEQRRSNYLGTWASGLAASLAARQERADARKQDVHNLLPGSVLVAVWGYEQTNVDFYQVIAVVSDKTVVIRKIGAVRSSTSDMSGTVTPDYNHFVGEPMRIRAGSKSVSIPHHYRASVWDGKPVAYSSWH